MFPPSDLEGLPPPKAQSVLLKRMESLEPVRHWIANSKKLIAWFPVDGCSVQVEKENILAKMQGAETPNISEQNQVGRNQGPCFPQITQLLMPGAHAASEGVL